MEEITPNGKIAEKIKKLLALAKGNTTEGEAEAAMAKVQELLASYNLTMAEVESHNADQKKAAETTRIKGRVEKAAMYEYQRNLMNAIAYAHFCLHWVSYHTKIGKSGRLIKTYYHVVIGREANVVTAKLMFEYLNSTIEKLSGEHFPVPYNLSRSAISWKEGCADRLCDRIRQRKNEQDHLNAEKVKKAKAENPECTLPTLVDVRQNEVYSNYDFAYGLEPGTTARRMAEYDANPSPDREETPAEKAKREKANQKAYERWKKEQERKRASKDWDAYSAGSERGKTIGLDDQVDGADDRRKLS